jgi:hypothetical protein
MPNDTMEMSNKIAYRILKASIVADVHADVIAARLGRSIRWVSRSLLGLRKLSLDDVSDLCRAIEAVPEPTVCPYGSWQSWGVRV